MNLDEMMTDAVAALDELWQDPVETAAEHRRLLHRMHEEEELEEVADAAPAQEPLPSAVAPVGEVLAKAAAKGEAAAAPLATRRLAAHEPHAGEAGAPTQEARYLRRSWFRDHGSPTAGIVEVRFVDSEVQVRDSKDPQGSVLVFNRDEWEAFLLGVSVGEFQELRSEPVDRLGEREVVSPSDRFQGHR